MRLLQGVGTIAAAVAMLVAPSAAHAVSLTTGIRAGDGPLASCAGLAQACTIDTPRGRAFEVRAAPLEAGPGLQLEVAVSWRAPGARRLAPRRTITTTLVPEVVGRRLVLPAIVQSAGTWCLVPRLLDAGADVVFGSGPHVVRGVERYRGR